MKYTCDWTEQKTGASGKTYYEVSLTAEDGTKIPKATTFDLLQAGTAYDGEIIFNGKFINFKKAIDPNIMGAKPAWAGKTNQIKQAQERKEAMILKAQDRKEESIAYFNSLNSAIALIKGNLPMETEEDIQTIKKNLIYWRDFFFNEWSNFNPEDHSTPF